MHQRHLHPVRGKSLSSRGGLLKTFGSLAGFLAFVLLAIGGYLVKDQVANPVQAHAATLLFAALAISAALILLYGLLYGAARNRFRATARTSRASGSPAEIIGMTRSHTLQWHALRDTSSFQGRYIDHARIRLSLSPQARGIAGK
jgi:hypothetical protein